MKKRGRTALTGYFFKPVIAIGSFFMPIPRSVSAPDSALTRRRVGVNCSMASCRPARRKCLPVLAPAQAFVRAGNGGDNSECGMRNRGASDALVRRCGSGAALCPRFAPGLRGSGAALCRRFMPGLRGSGAALCPRFASSLRGSGAALCPRFMPSLRGSGAALCIWCAPGLAFLLGAFASVHACCLPHGDKQDGLRYLAFLFRRVEIAIRAFSRRWRGYLPWRVHFGFGRFLQAIPTSYRERGERRTGNGDGGAALMPFAQSYWPCNAFRGEYAGAARPRLRQRVFDSLDSLQGLPERESAFHAAGLCWCGLVAFVRFCASTLALLCFPPGVRWGCAPQTAPKSQ